MGGFWSEVEVEKTERKKRRKDDFSYTGKPIFVSSTYCDARRMSTTPSNELSVHLMNYGIFPDLVISKIAQFLPIRSLPNFFSTCRLFFHCANSNHFWSTIFQCSFGKLCRDRISENQVNPTINWKKHFFFRYRQFREDFYRKKYSIHGQRSEEKPRHLKSIFLGRNGVGKTSFVDRAVHERFRICYRPTIGVDFQTLHFRIGSTGRSYVLQLWDTYGSEWFMNLFVRGAEIVFLCFSIDNRESFDGDDYGVKRFLESLKDFASLKDPDLRKDELPVIILLGLKCDLEDMRVVSSEEAMEFVRENRDFVHGYVENSSKTGKHRMVSLGVALDLVMKRIKYQEEEEEEEGEEDHV